MWERYEWGVIARWLPIFYFTEFLCLVCLLYFLRPQLCRERFFIASVAVLLIVPAYTFGWYNDWCMRTSFPALIALCWYTAHVVLNHRPGTTVEMWTDEPCGGKLQSKLRYICTRLAVAVLGIGAVTAVFEMNRANNHAGTFPYEHLSPSALTELSQIFRNYRVVYDLPDLLRKLLPSNDHTREKKEKGKLVIRSNYDVYIDGNLIVYVKRACTQADIDAQFYLRVLPVDVDDLPNYRTDQGAEILDFAFNNHGTFYSNVCVVMRPPAGV